MRPHAHAHMRARAPTLPSLTHSLNHPLTVGIFVIHRSNILGFSLVWQAYTFAEVAATMSAEEAEALMEFDTDGDGLLEEHEVRMCVHARLQAHACARV